MDNAAMTQMTQEQYNQYMAAYAVQGQMASPVAQQPVYQQTYQQPVQQKPVQNKSQSPSGFSYPNQVWVRQNNTQGLFLEDMLSMPEEDEYESGGGKLQPMFVHGRFSRFKIEILNYADKRSTYWNILPRDITTLRNDTMALHVLSVNRQYKPDTSVSGLAYTQVIAGGNNNIKGKTPAQAIIDNAAQNIPLLQQQAQWLMSNLAKYPKNQEQIDAIGNAFELYNAGKLQQSTLPVILYDKQKVPRAKVDENGYTAYISCKIECNFNKNYPIQVTIMNCLVKPKNRTTPDMSTMKDKKEYTYSLSLEDWDDIVDLMYCTKIAYDNDCIAQRRAMARKAADINRFQNYTPQQVQ